MTPLPLITSAWLIVPPFWTTKFTGIPALTVTVAGVIEYSLSTSVTLWDAAPEGLAGLPEFPLELTGEAAGAATVKVHVGADPATPVHAAVATAIAEQSTVLRIRGVNDPDRNPGFTEPGLLLV